VTLPKWQSTKIEMIDEDGQLLSGEYTDASFIFNADGSAVINFEGGESNDVACTYTHIDGKISLIPRDELDVEPLVIDVKKLTETELVLYFPEGSIEEDEPAMTYYYEKVR